MTTHSSQEIPDHDDGSDPRRAAACRWAGEALSRADLEFSVASADASFRRYFRARDPVSGTSWIVMDAPPEREDCEPFIDIAKRLFAAGIHAPRVLDQDPERGFLLLTDLGRKTFLDVLNGDNADALFSTAMRTLVQMQAGVATDGLPPYDAALLSRELNLYPEWYLGRHRGVVLSQSETVVWERSCRLLIESALAQPQAFVHRDFMPRNLMVSKPMPGVIDFQDAVRGPVTYDLVSLYRDAFISWPDAQVAEWVEAYRAMANAANVDLPEDFERALDWMGLQRHLKVIGIFARLHYRDGKQKYLAEIPRFLDYVFRFGARYREFDALLAVMRKYEELA